MLLLISKILVLSILGVWQIHLSEAISGTLDQNEYHVVEGDTAVCTCTVSNRNDEDIWWLIRYRNSAWYHSATSEMWFLTQPTFAEEFEFYYVSTNEFILIINNISKIISKTESAPTILCGYLVSITAFSITFGPLDQAKTRLWVKPKCTYEGIIPDVISICDSHWINLICSTEGYSNPSPGLRWYKNGIIQIAGPMNNTIETLVSTTAHYICQTDSAVELGRNLSCEVTPHLNNPKPDIQISSNKQTFAIGEQVLVRCTNTGISTGNTTYFWYLNGNLINETSHTGIAVITSTSDSVISIANYPFPSENIEITCIVVGPNIACTNISLTLTVPKIELTTEFIPVPTTKFVPVKITEFTPTVSRNPIDNEQMFELSPLVIVVAAILGSFVIIIIVVVVCVFTCMKWKNVHNRIKNLEAEIKSNSESRTQDAVALTVELDEAKYPASEMPKNPVHVYEDIGNGEKTEKKYATQIKLDEQNVDNAQYRGTGTKKEAHELIPMFDHLAKDRIEFPGNSKGLNYADIEIDSKQIGSGKSEDVKRKKKATVYADVKVFK